MEQLTGVVEFIEKNWMTIMVVLLGIHFVASMIANKTKNTWDDKVVTWSDKVIHFLAGNFFVLRGKPVPETQAEKIAKLQQVLEKVSAEKKTENN